MGLGSSEKAPVPGAGESSDATELRLPRLDGRHVYLRTVGPEDFSHLRLAETTGELAFRWRFRGATPGPDEWMQRTWSGVLAQFLVIERRRDRAVGVVAAFQPNFQDGHATMAAAKFDLSNPSPLLMLGVALFLDYVFGCWDLRKLYMEVPEYNYQQFASGEGRYFAVEGRLHDHFFLAGRHWDQLILALYRDAWEQCRHRLVHLEVSK